MEPVDLSQELRLLAGDIEVAFDSPGDRPYKAAYCHRLAKGWAERLRGRADPRCQAVSSEGLRCDLPAGHPAAPAGNLVFTAGKMTHEHFDDPVLIRWVEAPGGRLDPVPAAQVPVRGVARVDVDPARQRIVGAAPELWQLASGVHRQHEGE